MKIEPVALSLLGIVLISLAPTAVATPDAIVLTLQDNGPATLHWQVLTGPVQADAWIVTRIIDGVELAPIELAGTATSHAHQSIEGADTYVYSVYYVLDGQSSQQSNRLIVSDWPRCDFIGIFWPLEPHPECLFPMPLG